MKYPLTRHMPSSSFIGVTVSTAAFFFENEASNWMTRWRYSGWASMSRAQRKPTAKSTHPGGRALR